MSRKLILVAACVLAVVGLAALYAKNDTETAVFQPQNAWQQLPNDVLMVAHVDVAGLVASDFYKTMKKDQGDKMSDLEGEYAEFMAATGFDPETDLRTMTLGVAGDLDSKEGKFYMIATGNFDLPRIEAWMKSQTDVATAKVEGLTTHTMDLESNGDQPPSTLAWLDDSTLIAATQADFPELVRSIRGSGPDASTSELASVLAESSGQVYVALRIPETPDQPSPGPAGFLSQLQGPFQSLENVLLTLDVASGLDLAVHASTDTADNGQLLYEAMNGQLAMLKMMSAENPQAAEILSGLRLGHEGPLVSLSVSVSAETIQAALTDAGKPMGGTAIGG